MTINTSRRVVVFSTIDPRTFAPIVLMITPEGATEEVVSQCRLHIMGTLERHYPTNTPPFVESVAYLNEFPVLPGGVFIPDEKQEMVYSTANLQKKADAMVAQLLGNKGKGPLN